MHKRAQFLGEDLIGVGAGYGRLCLPITCARIAAIETSTVAPAHLISPACAHAGNADNNAAEHILMASSATARGGNGVARTLKHKTGKSLNS